MSPAAAQADGPSAFDWNAAAVLLHERITEAAEQAAPGNDVATQALLAVIARHAPVRPAAGERLVGVSRDLFVADGLPACQGCDRATFTPARDPLYPCRTTRDLGATLLGVAEVQAELHAMTAGAPSPPGGPSAPPIRRRASTHPALDGPDRAVNVVGALR